MEPLLAQVDRKTFAGRLRFPPEMEVPFQESYYYRNRTTVRFGIFFLAALSILSALYHMVSDEPVKIVPIFGFVAVIAINILLVVLAFHREFGKFWQPYMVTTTLVTLSVHLTATNYTAGVFFSIYLLLITSRIQRLQLRWMMLQSFGLLGIGVGAMVTYSLQINEPAEIATVLVSALVLVSVPLVFTFRGERFERREFLTKHRLAQERNAERQKREQTEQMLHVLSQAIGGIVHDLGNPLTSVQVGAETLRDVVRDGDLDRGMIEQFADVITDGAQMLNYLRLSLMEQTRVLENKPVPVELKRTSILHIVETGAHYQKPRFAAGRKVTFDGQDLEVHVDEMRFITIFMNLIGNALKYSDGEVKIVWRTHENKVLIAVQDQGSKGVGITRSQAERLFVAFGRLDTHAQIEGTGLGLLSVRKIAEAHKGEVYIEGRLDGTASAPPFSTAINKYPAMLEKNFRTAFVTTCPCS